MGIPPSPYVNAEPPGLAVSPRGSGAPLPVLGLAARGDVDEEVVHGTCRFGGLASPCILRQNTHQTLISYKRLKLIYKS